MKILFAASECAPIAKVGGLADFIGSLPKILKNFGIDVRIVIPKYEVISKKKWNLKPISNFYLNEEKIIIWQGFLERSGVLIYLLENEKYFSRGNIYPPSDDFLSLKRFLFFSKAIFEIFPKIHWFPDILHCNEWHTAILPVLAKLQIRNSKFEIQNLLTIHNLANQGKWNADDIFRFLNFRGNEIKSLKMRDKDGDFNILQQGILEADILTTVSKTYSREILTEKYGMGLEKTLRKNRKKLFGILNGIDTEIFNPATDQNLKVNYSFKNFEKKTENKIHLQEILKLPKNYEIPLMAFIGRLDSQKGLDLFEKVIPDFVKLNSQIVFLGVGAKNYERMVFEFFKKYPKNVSVNIKFDPILAQKIYAGADIILIPSLFEPCGLVQMIAQRYGTIPIARKTGGLNDAIEDGKTGFLFKEYSPIAFLKAVKRSLAIFADKKRWKKIIKRAMAKNFSWKKSAKEYIRLYKKLLRK